MFFLFSFLFNKISFIICSIPKKPFSPLKFFSTKKKKKKKKKRERKRKETREEEKKKHQDSKKKEINWLIVGKGSIVLQHQLVLCVEWCGKLPKMRVVVQFP